MFLSKPELFNACFLINSGVNLGDINPGKMIRPELWKEFISSFLHYWETEFHNQKNDPFSKLFNHIFVGDSSVLLKETIHPFTERILLIHGGADSTMPYDSITKIEPKQFGLSIFKVPGLKHFLPIDPEWDRWFPFVIRLVDQFEERATSQQWTRHDLINEIIKYQIKYYMFVSPFNCDTSRIADPAEKRQFEELMYIARAHYQNISTLILEVFLTLEREKFGKITEKHDSMLCRLAEKDRFITHNSLISVLIKQVELSKIKINKRAGEIMMDLNLITHEQLKHLLSQQNRMRN